MKEVITNMSLAETLIVSGVIIAAGILISVLITVIRKNAKKNKNDKPKTSL